MVYFKTLLIVTVFGITSYAFADDEEPCSEKNPCEEIVVTEPKPGDNEYLVYCLGQGNDPYYCVNTAIGSANPVTPAPSNSASDNCEGSGCINYEESYFGLDFDTSHCEVLNVPESYVFMQHYVKCLETAAIPALWCSAFGDFAKEVAAVGGCAAYFDKKKGKRKYFLIASCTVTVTLATATGCD